MNELETKEDTKELDEFLLNIRFPEECQRLPTHYLTDYEQDIVQKCINHKELTETEIKDLKN